MNFTKWARIGLKPRPEDIVLFYSNSYFEERKTRPEIPIFQVRYDTLFVRYFDEAKNAMLDFINREANFAKYFDGMSNEALEQYFQLIEKFKASQGVEDVVRIG